MKPIKILVFAAIASIFSCTVVVAATTQMSAFMKKTYHVTNSAFAVGQSSTMEKLFREDSYKGKLADKILISLAANEFEGSQIVIIPLGKDLKNVKVDVSDLVRIGGGESIRSKDILISPVGYVETTQPRYQVDRIGWWPDPLLPNKPFDVKTKHIQPVWITVHAVPGTKAGDYKGYVTVSAAGNIPVRIPICVKVWTFEIPREHHLRTMFNFSEGVVEGYYGTLLSSDQRRVWYKWIIDHRISPVALYPQNELYTSRRHYGDYWPPDMVPMKEQLLPRGDDIKYACDLGADSYNVGTHFQGPYIWSPGYVSELTTHLKELQERAVKEGWTDKAILYSFDEPPATDEWGERIQTRLADLRRAAPNFKTLVAFNTGTDGLKVFDKYAGDMVDIWCPISGQISDDPAFHEALKATGKEIWWYICCAPGPPYPTVALIESRGIESRLLPWMNWKYDVKGLLYHNLNWWVCNIKTYAKPWPESPWLTQQLVPQDNLPGWNGDGYLMYPGPNVTPLSSIRLENLRDGIEDYEYFYMLKKLVDSAKKRGIQDTKIEYAQKLLVMDESIAVNHRQHTIDPAVILKRRSNIAEAIEQLKSL